MMDDKIDLMKRICKANNVVWLCDEKLQRFWYTLAKGTPIIVPLMLIALVINGGLIVDGILVFLYICMFVQLILQKPYTELKKYSYDEFHSDIPFRNTMASTNLIGQAEKAINITTSDTERNNIYHELVTKLDGLYGPGNHFFVDVNNAPQYFEGKIVERGIAQFNDDVKAAKAKYEDKIKSIKTDADKQAKIILIAWFRPIIDKYAKVIQLVRESELMQYSIEGSKSQRGYKAKKLKEEYQGIADEILEDLEKIKRKYETMVNGVDINDELNVESQMYKRIYEFAIIESTDPEKDGLYHALWTCICTIKINPELRHNTDIGQQKRVYELLTELDIQHPDIDHTLYMSYCKLEVERKAWLDSKEGQKYLKSEVQREKQLQKRIAKEKQKEIKIALKQIDQEAKKREKDLAAAEKIRNDFRKRKRCY